MHRPQLLLYHPTNSREMWYKNDGATHIRNSSLNWVVRVVTFFAINTKSNNVKGI